MSKAPINVLFLCTHNSARSILAEAILNHIGAGRFQGFSAGSSPRDNQQPNPIGLQTLQAAGISTAGLRSKSWDEFALPEAPHMDLIITVCDNAAGEVCPYLAGQSRHRALGLSRPVCGRCRRCPQSHRIQANPARYPPAPGVASELARRQAGCHGAGPNRQRP